ncbi:MAG TPA: hypothetical protein VFX16_22035 [Pseudonocardiaceae bacterium]|nr:hypothetical protein [Pseudonocardiaceae bacterium]
MQGLAQAGGVVQIAGHHLGTPGGQRAVHGYPRRDPDPSVFLASRNH